MASGFRGFAAFVLILAAAGLGLAAIGLTYDRPVALDKWRVVDEDAATAAGILTAVEANGHEHCGWQHIRFLVIDPDFIDPGGDYTYAQFVRDPAGVLGNTNGLTAFQGDAEVPDDAVFSGLAKGRWELWLAADGRAAYVVGVGTAERWPRAKPSIVCA